MTTSKKLLALLAFAAAGLPLVAHGMDIQPVIVAGIETGGEKIATTTDGGSLKANDLISLGGGVSLLNDSKNLEFQLTLAWKYGNLNASDGKVSFTRYPVDALVFYRLQRIRFGGGITYHLNPKLSGSGAGAPVDGFKFDNAAGAVLQVDFLLGEHVTLGARYTNLSYKPKTGGDSISSNGGGVMFGYRF